MKLDKYGKVYTNVDLTSYNTYRINSSADYLIEVESVDKLVELLTYIKDNQLKYYVLGGGSNVILPNKHFNGIIISLKKLDKINISNDYVEAECGILLSSLVTKLMDKSLGGFEELKTIPGTLGGAIYGNAGVKDVCIMDNVISVKVIRESKLVTLEQEDINYSYRYTMFKENDDILVSAKLKVKVKDVSKMKEKIKDIQEKRRSTQPLDYPNAGSVFRNPVNDAAGRLIEKCGLKGYNIGGAYVSEKHANFIINKDNAKSSDIIKLIKEIQNKVKEEENVDLVLEQIIVKWDQMEKENKKVKKKIRVTGIIVIILFLYLLFSFCYYVYTLPIKVIDINGNYYLKDNYIIELLKLNEKTVFELHRGKSEKKLLSDPLVKDVKIKKGLMGKVSIDIEENKVLFYNWNTYKIVLEDGSEVDNNESFLGVPSLINYVPSEIYQKFVKKFANVDREIISMVSEIEYDPDVVGGVTVDETTFLLRMNDGISVYVNIYNIKKMNNYLEIYDAILKNNAQKNGCLYLDSESKNYVYGACKVVEESGVNEQII